MSKRHTKPPLFVAVEPSGARAQESPTRLAWACGSGAGVAEGARLAEAAREIAALARDHQLFLAEPLFDAPRLEALWAKAGIAGAPDGRDWLLALAPFRQARNLAAAMEAAGERTDPENRASLLYETWREIAARSEKK